ncbi:UNVERIFIED_CONTAM: hypothetical protein K2H54_014539 [Gekko kuhli]
MHRRDSLRSTSAHTLLLQLLYFPVGQGGRARPLVTKTGRAEEPDTAFPQQPRQSSLSATERNRSHCAVVTFFMVVFGKLCTKNFKIKKKNGLEAPKQVCVKVNESLGLGGICGGKDKVNTDANHRYGLSYRPSFWYQECSCQIV